MGNETNINIVEAVLGIDLREINMFPQSAFEEIIQNVRIILSTVQGTVPLDRNLGLSATFIEEPVQRAMMTFVVFATETIQDYEPRVVVEEIEWVQRPDEAMDGRLYPRVKVRILDEYLT